MLAQATLDAFDKRVDDVRFHLLPKLAARLDRRLKLGALDGTFHGLEFTPLANESGFGVDRLVESTASGTPPERVHRDRAP